MRSSEVLADAADSREGDAALIREWLKTALAKLPADPGLRGLDDLLKNNHSPGNLPN